jgi:hypothetical protein
MLHRTPPRVTASPQAFLYDPLTPLGRHLLHITAMQCQFVGHLLMRETESPEVQTQYPHVQGLMLSGQDGVGHIINACVTVVPRLALTGRFRIIKARRDDLGGFTRGARDAARPASCTDGLITLAVLDEMLAVDLTRWTPVRGRDMRGHRCILSSHATTLESNMSLAWNRPTNFSTSWHSVRLIDLMNRRLGSSRDNSSYCGE